jgi:hypothetical protein
MVMKVKVLGHTVKVSKQDKYKLEAKMEDV